MTLYDTACVLILFQINNVACHLMAAVLSCSSLSFDITSLQTLIIVGVQALPGQFLYIIISLLSNIISLLSHSSESGWRYMQCNALLSTTYITLQFIINNMHAKCDCLNLVFKKKTTWLLFL